MDKSTRLAERLNSKASDLEPDFRYVVGVAIFKATAPGSGARGRYELLVVKRAVHEDTFPNMWELPGGHVEPGETVRECVAREALEETGLVVNKVLGEFEEMRWTSSSKNRVNVQMNYAVTVRQPMRIQLNPDEHAEWRWIVESDVDTLPMTPAMNKVLKDSFHFSTIHAVL